MPKVGREREVNEIVMYLRAAQVGRVFLGQANGRLTPVFSEIVVDWPRARIRAERDRVRGYLSGEVKKFCRSNFPKITPLQLGRLYERLLQTNGHLRLPLTEFQEFANHDLRGSIFRDAPLHSTVHIDAYWGLKVEFPEYHLMNDLAFSFNEMRTLGSQIDKLQRLAWEEKKAREPEIAAKLRRSKAVSRMCLLSCFNLIEAYINGLAWEYAQTHQDQLPQLIRKEREMIKDGGGSILNRVINIPRIITGRPCSLSIDQYPLKEFEETIKPYRNSIVHASPFTAPEEFGGYDRLDKLYELSSETVVLAVKVTRDLIGAIHQHIGGKNDLPRWFLPWTSRKGFRFP